MYINELDIKLGLTECKKCWEYLTERYTLSRDTCFNCNIRDKWMIKTK